MKLDGALLIGLLAVLASSSLAGAGDAEDLLRCWEQSQRATARISFDLTSSTDYSGPLAKDYGLPQTYVSTVTFRRDGERRAISILRSRTLRDVGEEMPPTIDTAIQTLSAGGRIIGHQIMDGPPDEPPMHSAHFRRQPLPGDVYALVGLGPGALAEGRTYGDQWEPIPGLMRRFGARVVQAGEVLDGHTIHVLEAASANTRYKVWLDPAQGCLPRRLEMHKWGDATWLSRPLSAPPPPAIGRYGARQPLREVALVMDRVEFQTVGDVPLIARARVVTTETYADGGQVFADSRLERHNIIINPAFGDADFAVDIPDGLPIYNRDQPAIFYEWREGQIVRLLDQTVLKAVEDAVAPGYRPPPGDLTGLWFLSIAAVLALAAGAWAYWRRRAAAT